MRQPRRRRRTGGRLDAVESGGPHLAKHAVEVIEPAAAESWIELDPHLGIRHVSVLPPQPWSPGFGPAPTMIVQARASFARRLASPSLEVQAPVSEKDASSGPAKRSVDRQARNDVRRAGSGALGTSTRLVTLKPFTAPVVLSHSPSTQTSP